jgi:hypothetical protein
MRSQKTESIAHPQRVTEMLSTLPEKGVRIEARVSGRLQIRLAAQRSLKGE